MTIYTRFIRPLLFQLDPEKAHHLAHQGLAVASYLGPIPELCFGATGHKALQVNALGYGFDNPIGVAAGFDKNAELAHVLCRFGFGFAEVGSLSAQPCMGNPKPRLCRLPEDKALVNRMGLNNQGVVPRLQALRDLPPFAGINLTPTPGLLGQQAVDDLCQAYQQVCELGAYIAINISCPNTEDGRTFEDPEALAHLLEALNAIRHKVLKAKPLLAKLSPDSPIEHLPALLAVCQQAQLDGLIVSNTTKNRSALSANSLAYAEHFGRGGLSGAPLLEPSTALLGQVYQQTRHWVQPPVLIGVGGVMSAEDAWQKIINGANLVQVYTGWIYQGPSFAKQLNQGLLQKLQQAGLNHIEQAVGLAFA